jgi:hypothetical protein
MVRVFGSAAGAGRADARWQGRASRPEPWWSSLLGEWLDEPTQPLPLVDRPESAPAGEAAAGRGGRR